MKQSRTIQGLNIQWPWSELLLSGKKRVETRSYALPEKLKGVELAVIETAGPRGKKEAGIHKARIIGTIVFESSFRYKNKKEWLADRGRHLVSQDDSLYGFKSEKQKWGWVVKSFTKLDKPAPAPSKRGIIFAKSCLVPTK